MELPEAQSETPLSLLGNSEAGDDPEIEYRKPSHLAAFGLALSAVMLSLVAYVTTVELIRMPFPEVPLPELRSGCSSPSASPTNTACSP